MFSGRAAAMAPVSLFQLLDDAIGKPEVNVNLEALRRLLRVMLEHLSLLGLQHVIPEEGAQEAAPPPGQSHPARPRPGPQQEEGWTGTEAGAWDRGQPSQPPGDDELQGTRRGSADTGQMEKTEEKESGISKVEAFPTPLAAPPKMPLWSVPLYEGLVEAQAPSSMLTFIAGKGGRFGEKIWD